MTTMPDTENDHPNNQQHQEQEVIHYVWEKLMYVRKVNQRMTVKMDAGSVLLQ